MKVALLLSVASAFDTPVRRSLTNSELITGDAWSNFQDVFTSDTGTFDLRFWKRWEEVSGASADTAMLSLAALSNRLSSTMYPYTNFVRGFVDCSVQGYSTCSWWQWAQSWFVSVSEPKWVAPRAGEMMGVVTYQNYAREHFGKEFSLAFFDRYYTGNRIPSWEDNANHLKAIGFLNSAMAASRAAGHEPISVLYQLEPRLAFDQAAMLAVGWEGFAHLKPDEVKYASNGVFGWRHLDATLARLQTTDALGVLMSDTVFGAHLTYSATSSTYHIDLSSLEKYEPIAGYARLGGKATFQVSAGRLKTTRIEYGGTVYTEADGIGSIDRSHPVNVAFSTSVLAGWRFAEKALIASLLAMTNLVTHVKNLHLELAAAFQAVTVDSFSAQPMHAIRRLLDPYIHRSVQATNDNFRLLFDYHAAEFSLAPLHSSTQLELMDDSIANDPLNLADLDMERYAAARAMPPRVSTKAASNSSQEWSWRWHYRALTIQRLYAQLVECWLNKHYADDDAFGADTTLQRWYAEMVAKLPSLARAVEVSPEWADRGVLTRAGFVRLASTLMVWLSHIHEDVGHSAAAFVYSPIHTPMAVPADGRGVPLALHAFSNAAYRGFVFLERAALLDEPPDFWFDQPTRSCPWWCWWGSCCETRPPRTDDRTCFTTFQDALRELGQTDAAFSQCDESGFYSCVGRVETAVSS